MTNKRYLGKTQSWTLVGIFLFLSGVMSAVLHLFGKWIPNIVFSDWISLIVYTLSFVLTILFAKRFFPDEKTVGVYQRRARVSLWLILALIVVMPATTIVLSQIVSFIPTPEFMEEIFANMVQISLPSFLTVVIAAPILEELLCRGIMLKKMLREMSPYKAIAWSSLIFAVMHLNPWQGIAAFTIGYISGWLYWQTKSIIPSILIHFLNNGLAFAFLFFAPNKDDSIEEIIGSNYLAVLLLAIVVAITGLYFIYRKLELSRYEKF